MLSVPVLMYHHVSGDREITPSDFEAHLKYLKENGYRTLKLSELHDFLTGKIKIEGKAAVITFDDGYADNWICAWPILKEYGMNAVVFATTGRIGNGGIRQTLRGGGKSPDTLSDERGEAGFLSWKELEIMVSSGVFEVGSHTHTHRDFNKDGKYDNLEKEIELSVKAIRENLRVEPASIAWPWGQYDRDWENLLKKAGLKMAFITKPGANTAGTDPYYINRFKVRVGDISWLKRRLALYGIPLLAQSYGNIYGLDSWAKQKILRLFQD